MMVVLFKTQSRPDIDTAEYGKAARRMNVLASESPGFLSFKH